MADSVRDLQEQDVDELIAIRQLSYPGVGGASDAQERARQLERLPFMRGYFTGGRLVSSLVMFPLAVTLAGRVVSAGGLASVQTAPEHRRKGYVRALLADGLERLREAGTGWCLEFPFEPRYYARFGWQSVPSGFSLRLPARLLHDGSRSPEVARVHPLQGEAVESIQGIYHDWASGHNFALARDDRARRDWRRVFFDARTQSERFVYLLDGAYCVLELVRAGREQILRVFDYAYRTPSSRLDLLAFWGGFLGQADTVEVALAADDPLVWDMRGHLAPGQATLQVRIVDLRSALAPLSSPQSESFHVGVRDEFCAWNNGAFRLELSPSGTEVTPADDPPDLNLDIRALALLLCGALSAESAKNAGLIDEAVDIAGILASLSAGRIPFMAEADYF